MREDFIKAIQKHQAEFGLDLLDSRIESLADFYELIQKHNEILHLVAPTSAEEFALRHILESLTLLEFLPQSAKFADIGAGAGLPSLPCLIVREDLSGILIESKLKKAEFLKNVVERFSLESRVIVENKQFEELFQPDANFITCRALDKFTKKLPKILKWSKKCRILFFGGHNLGEELDKCGVKFERRLMPQSEQRFLFIAQI